MTEKKQLWNSDLSQYWKGKLRVNQLADDYAEQINKEALRKKVRKYNLEIFPAICFSRQIGVGALSLAEKTAQKIGYRVIDREVIETISKATDLNQASIATFDERYPGKLREWMGRILGDRAFDLDEYTRQLFVAAFFLAHMDKTVFVGRGIHLMLPRNRVFAVRCIGSIEYRIENLAQTLKVSRQKAKKILAQADQEQKDFFKKVHGKEKALPHEFDLIINMDTIRDTAAADAIVTLFESRFPVK
jgi:cytidylate kinase